MNKWKETPKGPKASNLKQSLNSSQRMSKRQAKEIFGEDISLSDYEEDNEDIAVFEHNR